MEAQAAAAGVSQHDVVEDGAADLGDHQDRGPRLAADGENAASFLGSDSLNKETQVFINFGQNS